ncbi:hypothetical protein J5X98_15170 [Leptothermofonsia sichuanensis E412]|jgi:hypothetical protein|uniref:hypothetical protein n=1 Tax=Leptothermofonsia sichuanensis TaxID=2917832 RepID=UPI001CA65E4C|nr:hypothetical protein [Leptothermofonsia sichuanensis]QZZ18797.1 hypothetical protein J5X98_15170 [Leptothermofonsia sichuanensis E412]
MATVNVTLNVQIVGGPQVLITRAKSVEAYDKIEVTVEPGAVNQVVEIQPGAASRVNFLLIKSTLYSQDDPARRLTYIVSDGTTDSGAIALDEPHFYLGRGAVSVFQRDPIILKFSSTYAANPANRATIEILVGRDPTP